MPAAISRSIVRSRGANADTISFALYRAMILERPAGGAVSKTLYFARLMRAQAVSCGLSSL